MRLIHVSARGGTDRPPFALAPAHRVALSLFALLACLSLHPAPTLAQAGGSAVRGRVMEVGSGRPLRDATVEVVPDGPSIRTDAEGQFTLADLPPGAIVLRVEASGYAGVVEELRLRAGVSLRVLFELEPQVVAMERLLVRVRGGRDTARVVSEATDAPSTGRAAVLLRERSPGVFVSVGSGYADTRATVLIRGMKSLLLDNEPVVYVDGVRVSSPASRDALRRGGASDVLNQLRAADIEEIVVLRGAAAAWEYPEATAGVILIRTRR